MLAGPDDAARHAVEPAGRLGRWRSKRSAEVWEVLGAGERPSSRGSGACLANTKKSSTGRPSIDRRRRAPTMAPPAARRRTCCELSSACCRIKPRRRRPMTKTRKGEAAAAGADRRSGLPACLPPAGVRVRQRCWPRARRRAPAPWQCGACCCRCLPAGPIVFCAADGGLKPTVMVTTARCALAVALYCVASGAVACASQHYLALCAAALLCGVVAPTNVGMITIQRSAGPGGDATEAHARVLLAWPGRRTANMLGSRFAGLMIDHGGFRTATPSACSH